MQDQTSPPGIEQTHHACASCKARKKKCDKGLPECSSCSRDRNRKGLKCDYSRPEPKSSNPSSPWPYRSSTGESGHGKREIDFPTMLFLDPKILQHGQVETPRAPVLVPAHILQLVGDVSDVHSNAAQFFNTIHVWMPFISKSRFYNYYLRPLFHSHADLVLLFICIKLIITLPHEMPEYSHTTLYQTAKQFYLEVEGSGIFSIRVLQSGVLLSLYELGHAIYPAAFLSIGGCARYAYALGINCGATSQGSKVLTLVEVEERRRVWWAIVILDRFVSIGCPGRPFASEEPELHDLLPADDSAWDQGIVQSEDYFTISSPLSSHMSKFALVCQAARLLGQVLNHVSSNVVNYEIHGEEASQLDRTIRAMISASKNLESPDYDQIAFGYSALMTLHEHIISYNTSRSNNFDRVRHSKSVLEELSKNMIKSLPEKLERLSRNSSDLSPWGIYLGYRAGVTYMRLSREIGSSDSFSSITLLKQALNILNARWNAAGIYLQLLEAREVTGVL